MAVLHLISRSPSASSALSQGLERTRAGDAVLLLRDAVYAALAGSAAATWLTEALARNVSVHCLLPDLRARGIEPAQLSEGITTVDYDGFVELSIRFPRNCSW